MPIFPLFLAFAVAIFGLPHSAFAKNQWTIGFAPALECATPGYCYVDSFTSADLQMKGSTDPATGGFKIKVTVTGALSQGAPANYPTNMVVLMLSRTDSNDCWVYESPFFPIVNGKGRLITTAAQLSGLPYGPALSELADGHAVMPCGFRSIMLSDETGSAQFGHMGVVGGQK